MDPARNPKILIAFALAAIVAVVACDAMQPQAATLERGEELRSLMGSDMSAIPDVKRVLRIGPGVPVRIIARTPGFDRSFRIEGMFRQLGVAAPFVGLGIGVGGAIVQDDDDPRCRFEDGMSGEEAQEFLDCLDDAEADDDCDIQLEFFFESDDEGGFDLEEIHVHRLEN